MRSELSILAAAFGLCHARGGAVTDSSQVEFSQADDLISGQTVAALKKIVSIPLRGRQTNRGHYFFLNATVGKPGKVLELLLDTGSTDTWVYGPTYCSGQAGMEEYQCCESRPGCFFE